MGTILVWTFVVSLVGLIVAVIISHNIFLRTGISNGVKIAELKELGDKVRFKDLPLNLKVCKVIVSIFGYVLLLSLVGLLIAFLLLISQH